MDWFFAGSAVDEAAARMRTEGDGMESIQQPVENKENAPSSSSSSTSVPRYGTLQRHRSESSSSDKYEPRYPPELGTLVNLTPKEIHFVSSRTKSLSKEPKFVPYEPYKAATKPIVRNHRAPSVEKKPSKNNMDLGTLVSQMALIDTNLIPFKSAKRPAKETPSKVKEHIEETKSPEVNCEIAKLKTELSEVKSENDALKEQIKQQAQVNKELKTMLVASMGEDLETTVQTLTEDKQQLASALINSAKHLSTHQEQTEWLAGQCEVWRSKFLASSLMVEELAGWKASFTQRTKDLESVLKQILEERNRIRDIQIHTHRNLQTLHENWLTNMASKELYYTSICDMGGFGVAEMMPIGSINIIASKPKSSNVLDLASVNLKYSENLCNGVEKVDGLTSLLNELPVNTDAENLAEKLLASPLELSGKNDHPSLALVNHAYARTGMVPNIACCSHCHGQVQLL